MISNQATTSANMTGNLFQIFNLPKAGGSSYLFSDIIKVIGSEADTQPTNGMTNAFFTDNSKALIDSTKLLNLLNASMTSSDSASSEVTDGLTGKYFISEDELSAFMNKLGIDETSGLTAGSSEIAIEITPDFISKIKALLSSSKNSISKNVFATLAPESTKDSAAEIKTNDDEKSEEAEGTEKIQVIFKKVDDTNDVIAAPQQFLFNNQTQYNIPAGGTSANEDTGENETAGDIVLGGSKPGLSNKAASNNQNSQASVITEAASVILPDVSDASENAAMGAGKPANTAFGEMLSAMASAGEQEEIPENTMQTVKNISQVENINTELTADETVESVADVKIPLNTKLAGTQKTDTAGSNNTVENAKDTSSKIFQGSLPVEDETSDKSEKAETVKEANKNVLQSNSVTDEKTNLSVNQSDGSKKNQIPAENQESVVSSDSETAVNDEVLLNKTVEKINIKQSQSDVIENNNEKTISKVDVKPDSKTDADSLDKNNISETVKNDTIKSQVKADTAVKTSTAEKSIQVDNSKKTALKESAASSDALKTNTDDDSYYEPDMAFRFSNRVSSEMLKRNFSNNFNSRDTGSRDTSKFYEISIEKTPSDSSYDDKVMPQDFNTSDYENLSSGMFSSKLTDSLKEHKGLDKTGAAEKTNTTGNSETKEGSSSQEQSSAGTGSNNNSSSETAGKQFAAKSSTSDTFAAHMQNRNVQVDETAAAKTVKSYTSGFKEIEASKLIDEIKNISLKGEKTNITLKLSPENLGTVKLSIDIKESVMSTSIEVENESVRQVVQNNMDTLRQTLQQNGIQLSSFSVSLSQQHEQKTPGKSGNKKEKYQENDEVKVTTEEKKTKTRKMGYNTYEYLA